MIIHHCSTGDCDICRRQKVEWLESELSSLRAENERLRKALQDVGNRLGRPTTNYAAPSYQVGEMRRTLLDASELVRASLSEARKGK